MPPTYETDATFDNQWRRLTQEQRRQFLKVITEQLIPALAEHRPLPAKLRIKRVQGSRDIFEMTWASDGQATFTYDDEVVGGEVHIRWRRIGTQMIFTKP